MTALINGAPVELAGSAAGILLANAHLEQRQYHASLTYARLHALAYGKPYADCVSPLDEFCPWQGGETPTEDMYGAAERRLNKIREELTANQIEQVANVAVWGFIPHWLFAVRLRLRLLPEDVVDRDDLVAGLDRIADRLGLEREREERPK